uniref:(northern house mosquito) hypothetical protein n=1 Tax=Culex pipiens TaxID=7175 RepID=A0A8D8KIS7_CULPI
MFLKVRRVFVRVGRKIRIFKGELQLRFQHLLLHICQQRVQVVLVKPTRFMSLLIVRLIVILQLLILNQILQDPLVVDKLHPDVKSHIGLLNAPRANLRRQRPVYPQPDPSDRKNHIRQRRVVQLRPQWQQIRLLLQTNPTKQRPQLHLLHHRRHNRPRRRQLGLHHLPRRLIRHHHVIPLQILHLFPIPVVFLLRPKHHRNRPLQQTTRSRQLRVQKVRRTDVLVPPPEPVRVSDPHKLDPLGAQRLVRRERVIAGGPPVGARLRVPTDDDAAARRGHREIRAGKTG